MTGMKKFLYLLLVCLCAALLPSCETYNPAEETLENFVKLVEKTIGMTVARADQYLTDRGFEQSYSDGTEAIYYNEAQQREVSIEAVGSPNDMKAKVNLAAGTIKNIAPDDYPEVVADIIESLKPQLRRYRRQVDILLTVHFDFSETDYDYFRSLGYIPDSSDSPIAIMRNQDDYTFAYTVFGCVPDEALIDFVVEKTREHESGFSSLCIIVRDHDDDSLFSGCSFAGRRNYDGTSECNFILSRNLPN